MAHLSLSSASGIGDWVLVGDSATFRLARLDVALGVAEADSVVEESESSLGAVTATRLRVRLVC